MAFVIHKAPKSPNILNVGCSLADSQDANYLGMR